MGGAAADRDTYAVSVSANRLNATDRHSPRPHTDWHFRNAGIWQLKMIRAGGVEASDQTVCHLSPGSHDETFAVHVLVIMEDYRGTSRGDELGLTADMRREVHR